MEPRVSIIVLNWNGKKYIRDCLESLLSINYNNYEVIVVDNASTDGSTDIIREYSKKYSKIKLIENKTNLGFSKGNNIGIKASKGEIIILLNNDTKVDREWLKEVVRTFNSDKNIGIVGSKLLYLETKKIQSLGCIEIFPGLWQNLTFIRQHNNLIEVDYVGGAALAIRRKVLCKIGLLDEDFFAFFEDTDLCYRAKKAGYKVVVNPKAIVYHYGSASWKHFPVKKVFLINKNRHIFALKHFDYRSILKYFVLYPVIFTLISFKKFIYRTSIIDIITNSNIKKKKIHRIKRAFIEYALSVAFFYISLLYVIICNRC